MNDDRFAEVLDRLEITELLARWHHACDESDWVTLRELVFDEHIAWTWEASDGRARASDSANGSEAVIEWVRAAMRGSTVRHFTTSHVFHIDGDVASTRSYMLVVDTTSLRILANGLVTANHLRTERGWRIRNLRVEEQIFDGAVALMADLVPKSPLSDAPLAM